MSSPGPRRSTVSRWTTLALLLAGGASGVWYAAAQPAYSTGDELVHVDYAYQLWLGRLPSFFDGPLLDPGVGFRPDLQWVEQHPPLFYALLAPVVGPLAAAGHQVEAVMAARLVMILMAAVSVLAVRWMVRGAFPGHEHVATAAALLYVLSSRLPRQGGAVYNDLPAVLAVAIATGLMFRALRDPSSRRLVAGLAVACAAASLVRFSAIPLVAGIVLALATHRLVVLRRPLQAVAETAACGVAVVLASGWWWWRNLERTGNLQGSRADYWIGVRGWEPRSLQEAADTEFWHTMLQQFFSTSLFRPIEPWYAEAWWGIALLFLAPLALGTVLVTLDVWRGRRHPDVGARVVVLLTLLGLVGTVVATQISYSMSSGSNLPRYFFALVPPAAALMAYGFCRARVLLVLLAAWVVVRLPLLALEVQSVLDRSPRGPQADAYPTIAWVAYAVVCLCAVVVLVDVLRRSRAARAEEPVPSPAPAG